MSDRRFFNKSERQLIYLDSRGKCAKCGARLNEGWHADHIYPFDLGGKTTISNAQALCPSCNTRKGDSVGDNVKLRGFQKRFVETALNEFDSGGNIIVANVHPGSGKTLAVLHTINEMFRRDMIDTAQVFVPRINLCQQFELDWREWQSKYAGRVMGDIEHRENNPPLLRGNFGYVTTYDSLRAAHDAPRRITDMASLRGSSYGNIHLVPATDHRSVLVCDEAQILGVDMEGSGGTRTADVIGELAERARYIFVLTGTPYRSDGKPLLFGKYTEPDENGLQYLKSDVQATYLQGVSEGYLRPFEFELYDGSAIQEDLRGNTELLRITEMDSGLYKVIEREGFWAELVDGFIFKLRELQTNVHASLCGMIGAINQKQATQIERYISRHHPNMRALIAISDDARAQNNLRKFKRGKHDVLITVRMAYVGYDYKPISVILALSDFRSTGFLDQFFARGMRMMQDIPAEQQVMWAIAPDDPRMKEYVNRKREEGREGIRRRTQIEREDAHEPSQPEMTIVYDERVGDARAVGIDKDGDVTSEEFPVLDSLQRKHKITTVPKTKLRALLADIGFNFGDLMRDRSSEQRSEQNERTAQEREMDIRREIKKVTKRCDAKLVNNPSIAWEYGDSYREMYGALGLPPVDKASRDQLKEYLRWLAESFEPRFVDRR